VFFRLILRQILKHGGAFSLLLLTWIAGGSLLFSYRDDLLVFFSRLLSGTPDSFSQKPEEAAALYRDARALLNEGDVKLELLARACQKSEPITEKLYRPHWLEQRREWNLGTRDKPALTTPESYFKEKQPIVLEALQKSLDAMTFSFTFLDEKGQTVYLPDWITELSRAVCQEQLGIFAWGDFVSFQENRLRQEIETGDSNLSPAAQEIVLLERLSQLPDYSLALVRYSGGDASSTECQAMQLDCLTLEEAIRVFNRRLHLSQGKEGQAFLNLAYLYGRRYKIKKERKDFDLALDNYAAAGKDPALSADKVTQVALLYTIAGDHRKALEELDTFAQRPTPEMIVLRKRILSALGSHGSADCLHPLKSRLLPECQP